MKIKLPHSALLLLILLLLSGCKEDIASLEITSGNHVNKFSEAGILPGPNQKLDDEPGDELVWVCKSDGATKYHRNRECGGLGRCTHKIEKQSKKDAEAVGLTSCSLKKCN
ncbi:MAG: hypothetical protein EOO50_02650 [Flavobacterium sp.]|uniref:hypothetical protein n=1 Tax=Flavobacterium sp. TaxID=239 RepID=UPI0011F471A5|nr:hypothetical protein [Flavobacterium sp.]RZJ68338.1 MAG: hypothetical protein EOO50_02650 [Flavobacterium sp.]